MRLCTLPLTDGVGPRRLGRSTKDPLSDPKQVSATTRGHSHAGHSGGQWRSPKGKGHKGPLQQQLARGSSRGEGARREPQVLPWHRGRQAAH